MANEFYLKQNNTKPSLAVQLLTDGSIVNLDGATVKFHMGTVVDSQATIVDAATGTVRYDWASGDTAKNGMYEAEFKVTFSDGKVETFPNNGYMFVNIIREVA